MITTIESRLVANYSPKVECFVSKKNVEKLKLYGLIYFCYFIHKLETQFFKRCEKQWFPPLFEQLRTLQRAVPEFYQIIFIEPLKLNPFVDVMAKL